MTAHTVPTEIAEALHTAALEQPAATGNEIVWYAGGSAMYVRVRGWDGSLGDMPMTTEELDAEDAAARAAAGDYRVAGPSPYTMRVEPLGGRHRAGESE